MIVPTVGRVVWYYPSGKSQLESGSQPCAALVAHVNGDRNINIAYFDPSGVARSQSSVPLVQDGDTVPEYGFCTWMPYQLGQAAKTESAEKLLQESKA